MPDKDGPAARPSLIVGLGGAGCDMVARLNEQWSALGRVAAANRDAAGLSRCPVARRLLLRGAPERWRADFSQLLAGHDRVVIIAGLGGGTGSAAAPVLARAAKDLGVYCLAAVTLPLSFEGRLEPARQGLAELTRLADEVLTVDLDRFLKNGPADAPVSALLHQAQRALLAMVRTSLDRLDRGG